MRDFAWWLLRKVLFFAFCAVTALLIHWYVWYY